MEHALDTNRTLGELATSIPAASRVFQRHRLDFCCHGDRPLGDACRDAGVDATALLGEIRAAAAASSEPPPRWDERPLADVIDHILDRYHAPLYAELDLVVALANKLVEVHSAAHPELPALAAVVRELADELRMHMSKEENVLFPWIRSGQGSTAQGPVRVMLMEHEAAGEYLARLRTMTGDYQPPEDACVTWVALYVRLEDLDRDLRDHIALENNVLFPRALRE